MKRYYINKADTEKVIDQITAAQRKANNFCNVAVKPYKGKKYDPENRAAARFTHCPKLEKWSMTKAAK